MSDTLTIALLITGTAFALLAAIVNARTPDLYTRMHGATKSATLGVGCTVLSAAVALGNMETTTVAILIIDLQFLTAPVAAHMVGRSSHRQQVSKWEGTIIDASQLRESAGDSSNDQEASPH